MKTILQSCLIGLAVLAVAGQARAEDWKVDGAHLELGAFAGFVFPADNSALYDRSGGAQQRAFTPGGDVGVRAAGYPLSFFGVEIEGALMPVGVRRNDDSALLYRFGAHGILQYPGRFTPFILAGGGGMGVESRFDIAGNDLDPAFYWGLGAKYYFNETHGFRFDARQIHVPVDSPNNDSNGTSPQHEILFALTYAIGRNSAGPADRDEDGIADAADACPDQAAQTKDGCPDTDGDGITDPNDKCPKIKGTEADGCPGDTDGDGVRDDKDECINEAGTLENGCPDPDPDGDGVAGEMDKCPTVASTEPDGCPANDSDKDGIVDDQDKCPETAGVAPDGCPPDADGDGVIDANDKCVNEPETQNGYQDADGCPDEVPVEVKKFTGAIKGITFRTGSSRIAKASNATLDEAVEVLKQYPELKLEIGGHTDSAGAESTNQRLSQRRADSVKAYFVSHGIDAERLTAVGYGESQPAADNATRAGRAQNRRIEFKLVN